MREYIALAEIQTPNRTFKPGDTLQESEVTMQMKELVLVVPKPTQVHEKKKQTKKEELLTENSSSVAVEKS